MSKANIETGGVDERTPLVGKQLSAYQRFFLADKNKTFAQDAEVAFRAACFILVMSMPFLLPQDDLPDDYMGKEFKASMKKGFYTQFTVSCFMFAYYKDLGNTVVNAITGTFGVWTAVFAIWILYGIYPTSVNEVTPGWLNFVALAYGAIYVWIMLWLNMNINAVIFGVSSFVWYLMAFMNPAPSNFATGFQIDLTGSATLELIASILGGSCACLAMCIPYPMLAIRKAEDSGRAVAATLISSWKDLAHFACAEDVSEMNEFVEARIKRDLREINAQVSTMTGNISVAWWECLGTGSIQRKREMLSTLAELLVEVYDCIFAVFAICLRDKNPSPMMKDVKPCVMVLIECTENLLDIALGAVKEAKVTPERTAALRSASFKTREAIRSLTTKFRDGKRTRTTKIVDKELMGEHSFCLTVCGFARDVADWGDKLATNTRPPPEGGFLGLRSLASIFDSNTLYKDDDHINFAVRNWIAVCLAFYLGYSSILDFDAVLDPSGIPKYQYNAAISSTMAVLLSKGLGSPITKNLSRLQGVILGTAVGSLIYLIIGLNCSIWATIGMSLVLFIMVCFTFFLYMNSTTNSYLAFLLVYYSTGRMIQGCGKGSGLSLGTVVLNLLITIIVMTVVDTCFQKGTAAEMATKALMDGWSDIKQQIVDLHDPDKKQIVFKTSETLGQLSLAQALGGFADQEPRWSKTAWRAGTFNKAVNTAFDVRYILTGMHLAASGGDNAPGTAKSAKLLAALQLEKFCDLTSRPIKRIDQTMDLLQILSHDSEQPCDKYEAAEAEVMKTFRRKYGALMDEVIDMANKDVNIMIPDTSDSLETDHAAQISYQLAAIDALIQSVRDLEGEIIFEG